MDRSLQARLIGASVLVLLLVLVVPELLSGRKTATPSPVVVESGKGTTRTYTIELGNTATPAASDKVVSRPLSSSPPPPAPLPQTAAPAQPPRSTTPTQPVRETTASAKRDAPPVAVRETIAPRETPVATASPARGTWSVQVGAFGSAESARKLVAGLSADGYAAYVSTTRRDGKTLHRVRVGPESARGAADALAGRLKARGLPVSLVAND